MPSQEGNMDKSKVGEGKSSSRGSRIILKVMFRRQVRGAARGTRHKVEVTRGALLPTSAASVL